MCHPVEFLPHGQKVRRPPGKGGGTVVSKGKIAYEGMAVVPLDPGLLSVSTCDGLKQSLPHSFHGPREIGCKPETFTMKQRDNVQPPPIANVTVDGTGRTVANTSQMTRDSQCYKDVIARMAGDAKRQGPGFAVCDYPGRIAMETTPAPRP